MGTLELTPWAPGQREHLPAVSAVTPPPVWLSPGMRKTYRFSQCSERAREVPFLHGAGSSCSQCGICFKLQAQAWF